jgi:hypothetical protein
LCSGYLIRVGVVRRRSRRRRRMCKTRLLWGNTLRDKRQARRVEKARTERLKW